MYKLQEGTIEALETLKKKIYTVHISRNFEMSWGYTEQLTINVHQQGSANVCQDVSQAEGHENTLPGSFKCNTWDLSVCRGN